MGDNIDIISPVIPRLLNLQQAASYLGRGPWAMRELVYKRELTPIRNTPRGKCYFDRADLDRWIEKHKVMR
jgi:hypothetical protein